MNAQTIEARRAATTGAVEDESVVAEGHAPITMLDSLPWSPRGFTLPGAFTAMAFVIVLFGALWVTP